MRLDNNNNSKGRNRRIHQRGRATTTRLARLGFSPAPVPVIQKPRTAINRRSLSVLPSSKQQREKKQVVMLRSVCINVTGNVNLKPNPNANANADHGDERHWMFAIGDERDRLGERMRRQLRLHGSEAEVDVVSK